METENIYVTRPDLPPLEEYVNEVAEIWQTHRLTNIGNKHQQFVQALCDHTDVPYVSLFSNGHMALELALLSLEKKGEVITTPFTFVSTANAIVRSGHTPVFCDIREDDYTIDADKIESLLTENTVAIVAVHVYGHVCDVKKIQEIADKHGLYVIYDAAHAFGVQKNGQNIAVFGDATMFSFHATKVFHTIEGGCVCTFNKAIHEKLKKLRNFGLCIPEGRLHYIGPNAKMNEFEAAMGICNLRHFSEHVERRKAIALRYRERLSQIEGIVFAKSQKNVLSNYAYLPILVDESILGKTRDDMDIELRHNGIYARKYFYPLITDEVCYQPYVKDHKFPVAQKISNRVLTLPIYPSLSIEEVDFICHAIYKICGLEESEERKNAKSDIFDSGTQWGTFYRRNHKKCTESV